MSKRIAVLVVSGILIATLLGGCGGTNTAPTVTPASGTALSVTPKTQAVAAKELKIGNIAPRSGAGGPYGITSGRGIDLAIEDINAAGGIKVGNDTYLLKAIHEDEKSDSAAATAAANKLYYEDQVKFFLNGGSISGLAAWSTVGGPQKVFQINLGVADQVIGPDKVWSFRVLHTANQTSAALFAFVKKKFPGQTRVATVVRNDPAGLSGVPSVVAAAEGVGFTVVAKETVPIPTSDFVPLLNKILPLKPDFISANISQSEVGLLMKQATAMGWKGILLGGEGMVSKETFEIGGKENVQDRIYGVAGDYSSPLTPELAKTIAAKYQQKYGEAFGVHAAPGYNEVLILKAALEKAGSLDTDKLVNALEGMETVPTIDGPAKFGGQTIFGIKRQLYYPTMISVARDGKFEGIEMLQVDSFYRP